MEPDKPTLPEIGARHYPAIALIEFGSIAAGITAADAMVKKAPIAVLKAGTVHPGKYLVLIGGEVAPVKESYEEGLNVRPELVVDSVVLSDVHRQVHDAVLGKKTKSNFEALAVIETSTVAAAIEAADAAVKGADVVILEIRLADGLGGNAFALFDGKVENAQAAVEAGAAKLKNRNVQIYTTVIPRLDEEVAGRINSSSRFYEKSE
ncbi:MAG: BMC domain-containing protein [Elusimicrobia bacterium]|nr:BMC domain-containing protein [Elusimicrobiota bacterium]